MSLSASDNSTATYTTTNYCNLSSHWTNVERVPKVCDGEGPIYDRPKDDRHLPGTRLSGLRSKPIGKADYLHQKIWLSRTHKEVQITLCALKGKRQILSDKRKRALAQAFGVSRQRPFKKMCGKTDEKRDKKPDQSNI